MSKKESNPVDLNEAETRELLVDYAKRVQFLDEEMESLKEDKKGIFADAKNDGFDATLLRKAIASIRKEKSTDEIEKSEQELYEELIQNAIKPLK